MKTLIAFLMVLAPLGVWADDSTPVQLNISYSGAGQFTFEKNAYNYAGLLQAIRAEYGAQHIATITVDMGDDTNLADRLKVCRLKLDTGAQVSVTFTSNGQQNTIYCN
ncbi:MAG: hypothetical protein ACM3ZT_03040 [Bacillota bacterium]